MKKYIFLLLPALLLSSCAYISPKTDLKPRISRLESRVDTIEQELDLQSRLKEVESRLDDLKQELDQELKNYKKEQKKSENSNFSKNSFSQPLATSMQSSSGDSEKKTKRKNRDKEFYSQALDLFLNKEDPPKAREKFKKFLDKYPNSELIPNAYYWIGETYYKQKQYSQSILYFKKVYNNFPEDNKAKDALLKTGYAYARKGDISNATFYLNNLIEKNPQTKAARLAQRRLKSLNKKD